MAVFENGRTVEISNYLNSFEFLWISFEVSCLPDQTVSKSADETSHKVPEVTVNGISI